MHFIFLPKSFLDSAEQTRDQRKLKIKEIKFSKKKPNFSRQSVLPIRVALPLIKSIDGHAALHALLFSHA